VKSNGVCRQVSVARRLFACSHVRLHSVTVLATDKFILKKGKGQIIQASNGKFLPRIRGISMQDTAQREGKGTRSCAVGVRSTACGLHAGGVYICGLEADQINAGLSLPRGRKATESNVRSHVARHSGLEKTSLLCMVAPNTISFLALISCDPLAACVDSTFREFNLEVGGCVLMSVIRCVLFSIIPHLDIVGGAKSILDPSLHAFCRVMQLDCSRASSKHVLSAHSSWDLHNRDAVWPGLCCLQAAIHLC